jgi:hypothetical protein
MSVTLFVDAIDKTKCLHIVLSLHLRFDWLHVRLEAGCLGSSALEDRILRKDAR